jgi:hypothetical protein
MIQAMAADWRGPKGRRRLAALGASAAFHALILGLIGIGLVQTRESIVDEAPVLELDLTPRPLMPGEVARRPSRVAATEDASPLPATSAARLPEEALQAVAPAPRQAPPALPVPATPGLQGPPATAPSAGAVSDPWRYRPLDQRGAMARSLRLGAAGCRTMDGNLSAGEQQLCDERFNAGAAEAARRHPPGERALSPSEARREAQFAQEGAAAMARYQRRRSGPGPGTGVSGASPECVGGNLRGTCPGANLPSHYQHQEEAPFSGGGRPK